MSKSDYTAEDFVLDPEFRKWVFSNNLEAKEYWEDFMKHHPGKLTDIETARNILLHLSREVGELNDEEVNLQWDQIDRRVDQIEAQKHSSKVVAIDSWTAIQQHKESSYRRRNAIYKRTLAITSFLVVGFVSLIWLQWQKVEPLVEPIIEYETINAPAGVKSSVSLPDGSKVILNSASSIKFQKQFIGDKREVELIGEAFFDVAKDTLRPFIVSTNQVKTMAVGTSFNIRAYEGDSMQVALVSGVVQVANDALDQEESLMPGEGIGASANNLNWKKGKFDMEETLSWMNKTLIFKASPFEDAISKLERWYGVHFNIEGEIPKGIFISGKFHDETLANILDGLSFSSRINYDIKGSEVNLKFKPPNK